MTFMKNLAIYTLSFVLLFGLFWQLDWQQLSTSFQQTNLTLFFVAISFTCFSYLIHAMRWKVFFSEPGTDLFTILKTVVIGHMFNALLPSKSGELIRPLFLKRSTNISYSNILATCLIERVFDGLLILGCLGGGIVYLSAELLDTNTTIAAGLACLVLYSLVAGLLAATYYFQGPITNLLSKFLPDPVFKKVESIIIEFSQGTRRLNKLKSLKILLLSILYWLLNIGAVWFALMAIELPSDLQSFQISMLLVGTLGVSLAMPSAPANIGLFHFTAYSVLAVASGQTLGEDFTSNTNFVSASVIIHLAALIPDLLAGGASYLSFPKGKRAEVVQEGLS